jgi:hypothetical protein
MNIYKWEIARKALRSNLIILIAHLIKLYVQKDAPDWMTNSWYNSIILMI